MVAVVVALVVVLVVMPVLALVVDLGLTRAATGQAQSAADAAALAAAVYRPPATDDVRVTDAVTAAYRLAQDDFGVTEDQWASCVDPQPLPTAPLPGNCVSFDFATNRVRVTLPSRQIPGVFSGLLGTRPPAASATSVATWGAFSPAEALPDGPVRLVTPSS